MPRRYNLRPRKDTDVKWIEDETLKDEEDESESEDEDYEPSDHDEEDAELDEEMDEDEEESSSDEEAQKTINVPIPKNARVTIEIDTRKSLMDDIEIDFGQDEDEEEEDDEFMEYLMNKYVPSSRISKSKKNKKDDKDDSPALALNSDEKEYFDDLPKSKQKKLKSQMKNIATLVKNGDVPPKFRVLELPIPESVKATVIKKIDLLEMMDGGESYKLRNWVEGFLRIPFGTNLPLPVKLTDGPKPCAEFLADTRKLLDGSVYGMNSAKTQIMQTLAQWISNPDSVGNVIALKGPPGVGKTSFARTGIAKVLKRPFEFFSLGGAADSSNFVGHSYTYEGSGWGRIADAVMSAKCMNPVMYFDELDKVSTTAQGEEIVSMLIHLTDRSQNSQFHDRYFAGVDFDLSQCLFVFSFNDESKVHPILKDRMQVIHCAGYTADEKKIILTQYVWPQILERIKMTEDLKISDEAVKYLIHEYSHEEEGVRTLIRAVEMLVTRINLLRIADEETAKSYKFYKKISLPCTIDVDTAKHILQDIATQPNESWRHIYV
jgi:ATP-dependent Lon protease